MASWKDYENARKNNGNTVSEAQSGNAIKQQYLFLKKKADEGDADAMNDLGIRLFRGDFDGLFEHKRAVNMAIPYLNHAADYGSTYAQTCLGVIYESGMLGNKDVDKAEAFYTLAARQNVGKAQYRLGVIRFSKGERDGIHWICCAHLNGEKEATELLKFIIQKSDSSREMQELIQRQINRIKNNGIIPD